MKTKTKLQKAYDNFHMQVYKEAFPPADFLALAEESRKGPVDKDGRHFFPYDSYYIYDKRLKDLSDKWFKEAKLPAYKRSAWGMMAFLGITPSSNEKICKKLFEESGYAKLQGEERVKFAVSWLLTELSHRSTPTFHYTDEEENPFSGHELTDEQVTASWRLVNESMSLTEEEAGKVKAEAECKIGKEISL